MSEDVKPESSPATAEPQTAEEPQIENLFYPAANDAKAESSPAPNSETSANAGTVETEAATEPAATETEPEHGKSPRSSWKELRESRDTEREARIRAEERLNLLEEQMRKPAESQPAKPAPQPSTDRPKESDFETYGEFLEASLAWVRDDVKREFKREQEESAKAAKEASEKQKRDESQAKTAKQWADGVEKTRKAHADFEAKAYSRDLPINQATYNFLMNSEIGPEILYALGSDLKEAARIAGLDDHAAYVALAKMELKLSEKPNGSTPAITRAPRPAEDIALSTGVQREKPIEDYFYSK